MRRFSLLPPAGKVAVGRIRARAAYVDWISRPARRSANASRISSRVFMTKGPPMATGSSMIGLANRRTRDRHGADCQRVVAVAAPRRNGPCDVSGVCLPLFRAKQCSAFEHVGDGALAGGNGRIDRRAGIHVQVDQGHRPCRRMRHDDIAELAGVHARLHALLPMNRRVGSPDVLISRGNAFQSGGKIEPELQRLHAAGAGISLCMTPPPAVMNCASPALRRPARPV